MEDFLRRLDGGVDKVRQLTRQFCEALNITVFGYVRVYHDGRVGWVTSNADQDRLLLESGSIKDDPLIDTAKALQQGHYLWFHDRQFPGSETFYRNRAKYFQMDHGMVVVNHQKDYLETTCFSGNLSKRPLYNTFINELGLFKAFTEQFKKQLTPNLVNLLEDGMHLKDLKGCYGEPYQNLNERETILQTLGWARRPLAPRELDCLALLKEGFTYQGIACRLQLSPRTVEHYLASVKNKWDLETHAELVQAAHELSQMGLLPAPKSKTPFRY